MPNKNKTAIEELDKLYPGIKDINKACEQCPSLVHASNILKKTDDCASFPESNSKRIKLNTIIPEYLKYLEAQQKLSLDISNTTFESFVNEEKDKINDIINKRVALLNSYYTFFEEKEIEGDKGFDSRSKIRSTILEEFMFLLFQDFVLLLHKVSGLEEPVIKNGGIEAYSNLFFTSSSIKDFIVAPSIGINTKQQDYAIYREVLISIKNAADSEQTAKVPILAIENKTFLDKTMLEGAIATAEKIKMGAPYSVYIVATETYAVKYDVDPVYSRIDQIFVLRKCKHDKGNRLPKDIDSGVVKRMYWFVVSKLLRPWTTIEKRVLDTGTVI